MHSSEGHKGSGKVKVPGNTKVKVHFLGGFRGITGKWEDKVTVPQGTTVRMLLDKLAEKYGDAFKELVWSSDGKLRPPCKLFLGLEEVSPEDLDREVSDEVNLFFLAVLRAG